MNRQPVDSLSQGSEVDSIFILKRKLIKKNPDGSQFALFQFSDNSGVLGGVLWDGVRDACERLTQGRFVRVVGDVQEYRDNLQVRVRYIEPVSGSQFDLADFLPVTPHDRDEMLSEWKSRIADIDDTQLRALMTAMTDDEDLGWRFCSAPAGKTWHHPYVGGLLEHVVNLTRLTMKICEVYPDLDRDLLLAGCFLHDLGKVHEMEYDKAIDYSSSGKLLGHVVQGVEILNEFLPSFPELDREIMLRLKHIIVSHQGQYEYGSPKLPKSLEAIVFHLLDNIDAQYDGFSRVLREGRETMGADSNWTAVSKLLGRNLYLGGNEE